MRPPKSKPVPRLRLDFLKLRVKPNSVIPYYLFLHVFDTQTAPPPQDGGKREHMICTCRDLRN